MINSYFEKLQSKPTHEKRRFALQCSSVITSAIFLVWLATLGPRILAQITPVDKTKIASNSGGNVFGVVASVGAALSGQWNQTKSMLTAVSSDANWSGNASGTPDSSLQQSDSQVGDMAEPAAVILIPSSVSNDDSVTN